jgi:hypothetical protein
MLDTASAQARITIAQDGVRSAFSALMKVQHYEIFVDDEKVGELTGYTNRGSYTLSPGAHSMYVRAYARDSVSVTRVYGYSKALAIDLSPAEHKHFSCGLMPGPPLRKPLILGSVLITLLLAIGIGPIGHIAQHTRYVLVMTMALVTIACCWYGYSSKPGSSIYLRETRQQFPMS